MPRGSFSSFVDNVAAADSVAQKVLPGCRRCSEVSAKGRNSRHRVKWKELRARVAALEQQLLTLGASRSELR